jgi:hypothetical protein
MTPFRAVAPAPFRKAVGVLLTRSDEKSPTTVLTRPWVQVGYGKGWWNTFPIEEEIFANSYRVQLKSRPVRSGFPLVGVTPADLIKKASSMVSHDMTLLAGPAELGACWKVPPRRVSGAIRKKARALASLWKAVRPYGKSVGDALVRLDELENRLLPVARNEVLDVGFGRERGESAPIPLRETVLRSAHHRLAAALGWAELLRKE